MIDSKVLTYEVAFVHPIGFCSRSEGILRLQERGVMDKLHTKWWKAKRGGGACQKKESTEAESLNLDHLEGVFFVLTYGSFFALVYGIADTVRLIRKRARSAKVRTYIHLLINN